MDGKGGECWQRVVGKLSDALRVYPLFDAEVFVRSCLGICEGDGIWGR